MQSLNCICPTNDITMATFHTRKQNKQPTRRRTNSCFSVSEDERRCQECFGTVPISSACLYSTPWLPGTHLVLRVTLTSFCPSLPPQQHRFSFLYTLVFYKHTAKYSGEYIQTWCFFWHSYSVWCKNWDSRTDGLLDFFHSSLSTPMGRTFCPFIALTCQLRDETKERKSSTKMW